MNKKRLYKEKKSRRSYRISTASIGEILLAKANSGDENARDVTNKLLHKKHVKRNR